MAIPIRAFCTVRQPAEIGFACRQLQHRDRQDPQLPQDLNLLVDRITRGGQRRVTPSLQAVARHLQRTHHWYEFEIASPDDPLLPQWAWASNALLMLPEGTICDPAGRTLVDVNSGEPAGDAEIPFPKEARQRQLQTELVLRNRLIDTPSVLPPVICESEVILRDAEAVAWRSLALFVVAVRAESVAAGRPIPTSRIQAKSPLAFQALTTAEKQFLQAASPSEQQAVDAAWRYESLHVLQWSLGMHPQLKFPDEICDIPTIARMMLEREEREIIANATLRDISEILDALDQNQRLLWAARDAHERQAPPPAAIDGAVLSERQTALNWLVRFEDADWDHVDIPS